MGFLKNTFKKYNVVMAGVSTFQLYDHTQPATMKAKELKCDEATLEKCLREHFKLSDNFESSLSQPKRGSWVFKAKGKEYTVTKLG